MIWMKHSLRDRDASSCIAAPSVDPSPRDDGNEGFVLAGPIIRGMSIAASVLIPLMLTIPASAAPPCQTPPCVPAPLTVSMVSSLEFGTIASDATLSGSVTISPRGGKTVIGAYDMGGIHNAAQFAVTGEKNTLVIITFPASATLTSGANSVILDTFTSNPASPGRLVGNGTLNVNVGATLHIGANQPGGTYSGVFDVTVNY